MCWSGLQWIVCSVQICCCMHRCNVPLLLDFSSEYQLPDYYNIHFSRRSQRDNLKLDLKMMFDLDSRAQITLCVCLEMQEKYECEYFL